MLHVVHCTPEVVPFSKTGGLADVSAALPEALTRLGHAVVVVTPLYARVDRERHGVRATGHTLAVTLQGRTETFEVFEAHLPAGTRVVLLAHDGFFGRPELYGTRDGDYPDNHLRFAFFSAAVFRLLRAGRSSPGLVFDHVHPPLTHPPILHAHDWQAGLVPAFNRLYHLDLCGTVFTVHNLAYQGLFPAEALPGAGLPWDVFNPEQVEFYGKVNFLKAGLVFAHRITTVSPGYAREIMTPEFGCGLDGVLRKRASDVVGVLNGVDYTEWNPETDHHLPARYGPGDLSGKAECRRVLLAEYGLEASDGPLFGAVGRLAAQKGFDLVAQVLPDLVKMGARIVILGTGDRDVEQALAEAATAHPGKVGLRIAFDNRLAHLIEAGSDFFLMPSRYEPCGLNQMYSLKYGTLPVVHAVGGLEDTVVDVTEDPERGTGIKFRAFTRDAFLHALRRAADLHADRAALDAVRRRGMAQDFSWDAAARTYEALYKQVVG